MKKRLLSCALLLCMSTARAEAARLESHWLTVNGHAIHYVARGHGRPLLLLHGGGATPHDSFSKQMRAFAAEHRVIAPEQVGHGRTPDLPGPLSYTRMMEDTAALLAGLALAQVDVVGFSDGGIIALMLAAHHPELVRRVVVSGANMAPDGVEDEVLANEQARLANPHAVDVGLHHELSFEDKLIRLWTQSPTDDELNPDLLARITQRVLVMSGDHDVIKMSHTFAIYDALPDARLWILPNTSHSTFSERPTWVNNEVLAFLQAP